MEPQPSGKLFRKYGVVVLGDLAVFVLFTVLGLRSHGESLNLEGFGRVLLPLAISWFLLGSFLGAYRWRILRDPAQAWWRVLVIWLLSGTVGLMVRSWWLHRPPAPAFLLIVLTLNAVLLVAWRITLALWWRRQARAPAGALRAFPGV